MGTKGVLSGSNNNLFAFEAHIFFMIKIITILCHI